MTHGDGTLPQYRANELDMVLATTFQRRAEPNFAWKSACSQFMVLPGLRGFWPMSAVGYQATDRAKDQSGNGYPLTENNTPLFGYDNLAPYVEFDGASTEYLYRADGGAANWADITGGESYIDGTYQGLTLGGWFQIGSTGSVMQFMSKYTNADRAYMIWSTAADLPSFAISATGAAPNITAVSTVAISADTWYFIVGRFDASDSVVVFQDNVKYSAIAVMPAAINDSAADFRIGARGDNQDYLTGKASMCFLCATALSDSHIFCLYEQSRSMFGK